MSAPRSAFALGCALAWACGGASLPVPAKGPEPPPSAFQEVPDAPPPGRPEIIRPMKPPAVWVDGQWERVEDKWRWARGGWVVPPPGARFTPFRIQRGKDGVLRFAEARWVDASGRAIQVERLQSVRP